MDMKFSVIFAVLFCTSYAAFATSLSPVASCHGGSLSSGGGSMVTLLYTIINNVNR